MIRTHRILCIGAFALAQVGCGSSSPGGTASDIASVNESAPTDGPSQDRSSTADFRMDVLMDTTPPRTDATARWSDAMGDLRTDSTSRCAVGFRYPAGPETHVELFGDFNNWMQGIPMKKSGANWETSLVFALGQRVLYKFRVDGTHWASDPNNPRTTNDVYRNSILDVDCDAQPIDGGIEDAVPADLLPQADRALLDSAPDFPSTDLPDLVISAFTTSETGRLGDIINFMVKVCNIGTGNAPPSVVELRYDGSARDCNNAAVKADQKKGIGSLVSGACTTVTFQRHFTPPGRYLASAKADASCTIIESDETNNVERKRYTAGGGTLPDLYIKSFKATDAGSYRYFEVEACNQGLTVTKSFNLALFYHGSSVKCGDTPSDRKVTRGLEYGKCLTFSFRWLGGVGVPAVSSAFVDASCEINEGSNEGNNIMSIKYP